MVSSRRNRSVQGVQTSYWKAFGKEDHQTSSGVASSKPVVSQLPRYRREGNLQLLGHISAATRIPHSFIVVYITSWRSQGGSTGRGLTKPSYHPWRTRIPFRPTSSGIIQQARCYWSHTRPYGSHSHGCLRHRQGSGTYHTAGDLGGHYATQRRD